MSPLDHDGRRGMEAADAAPQDAAPVTRAAEAGRGRDDRDGRDSAPPPPRRRLALLVAVPLALLLAWGVFVHWRQSSDASETLRQAQSSVPDVHLATVKRTADVTPTTLPGQTVAYDSADLYPRATGYISQRLVDIGSHVRKGQLMLKIAAPDLDQQLAQAEAQLGQMQAQLAEAQSSLQQATSNSKLAGLNSKRSNILSSEGWDTKENRDNLATSADVSKKSVQSAQAGIGVAVANVRAQQATVDRLVALTGFEQVTAPFDGVVTQRNVDVGDLVQSDISSGTPVLHVDRDDILRTQVYVPQSEFAGIHQGLPAHVTVPELPGQLFRAVVSRSSVSLAQNSRSLLVEVDIDNGEYKLQPGLFVDVAFDVRRAAPQVVIPDAALIFDAAGLHVALVGQDDTVEMRPISIARDTGTEAELRDGLDGGEKVIVNPPTDLTAGEKVHVVPDQSGTSKDGKQAAG